MRERKQQKGFTLIELFIVIAIVGIIAAIAIPNLLNAINKKKEGPTSASGATLAKPYEVKKNSEGRTLEQQRIYDRIRVTTDPTKVMWIQLIALDGHIVSRMAVSGKITSSGKRLEPVTADGGGGDFKRALPSYSGYFTEELIQPDGTYGSSDNYVYWFDPMGRYHQLGTAGGLGYLLTDYPIDLVDPIDKITGLYRAEEASARWQAEQEARLRAEPSNQ